MTAPNETGRGSTGEHPLASARTGSSIVQLLASGHPDDRPTVITSSRTSPALNAIAVGQRLGHFELVEPIGRGGMATVFKARDTELGRVVALKILPPETAGDAETVSRFKQEGRAAAALDHDRIARVYFCGEDRGLHFIAFEFVAGDNLSHIIHQQKRIQPADAVRWMADVAAGLQHAAERGVVHRDIKPSNIIIAPDGTAKIVDMGLARQFDALPANGGVTQSGVTLGTFDYISPEQALDPRRADVRSDIYSLGCAFYHALTGVPPVPEGTAARKLHAHQHEAPLDPRDHNPAVPDALAAVLAAMMAKDPAKRPQSANALLGMLKQAAPTCGATLEAVPTELAVPVLSGSRVPTAWLLAASVAVIAVAVLMALPDRRTPRTAPAWDDGTASKSIPPVLPNNPNVAVADAPRGMMTVSDLAAAFKTGGPVVVKLNAGSTYDLTTLPEGILAECASVIIESDGAGPPPVLRVKPVLFEATLPDSGGFIIRQAATVKLSGIHVVVASAHESFSQVISAALRFDNVGTLTIDGCTFTAETDTRDDRIAGLAIRWPSTVAIRNTLLDFGEQNQALLTNDSATITMTECAIAPHKHVAELNDLSDPAGASLTLQQCTVMLERGAIAFLNNFKGRTKLALGHCVFANVESKEESAAMPDPVLFDAGSFEFTAPQVNAFFGVTMPKATTGNNLRILSRSPWAVTDPRKLLNSRDYAAAFRLNLQDSRLRLPAASGLVLLGAKSLGHPAARIYPGPWPPERPALVKAGPLERVVWPEADGDDAANRLYPTFAAAFAALESGESLNIAVNGNVPVPPLPEKPLKATIKPHAGYKPVLTADGPAFSVDAALFKLASGELNFELLGIDLHDRQCVVSAAGGTAVAFRNCTITLVEKDNRTAAAVVIPDPAREMKPPGSADDGPKVRFENCIVRGDGRAVWCQAARPFDVTLDNVALALDGAAFVVDPVDKATDAPKVAVTLRHVTAVLTGALIEVKTGRTGGGTAAALTVDATDSLFAAADARGTATPLVMLDDADAAMDLAKFLTWNGAKNVYSFSDGAAAVEWRGSGEAMAATWDWPAWLRFARDEGQHKPRMRFAKGSLNQKQMTALSGNFELSLLNASEAGVDAKKLP